MSARPRSFSKFRDVQAELEQSGAAIFRDAAWLWFRGGLTAGDVLRLSGRLYRAGDRRYAADLLSVLGAHLLTLGHSELQGEKGDRTGGGP